MRIQRVESFHRYRRPGEEMKEGEEEGGEVSFGRMKLRIDAS